MPSMINPLTHRLYWTPTNRERKMMGVQSYFLVINRRVSNQYPINIDADQLGDGEVRLLWWVRPAFLASAATRVRPLLQQGNSCPRIGDWHQGA